MKIYVFDGSFYGILTAVFDSYFRKEYPIQLISKENSTLNMFDESIEIVTDSEKAKRVWKGLQNKISKTHQKHFYSAFLSEKPEIFQHLIDYAHYIFDNPEGFDGNYGNEHVLALAQMSQKVHREKHRMEAFIRFQKSADGMFFAIIHPDYNVIPLLTRHFKNRYADQPWIIYDEKRKYGIHYDLNSVHEIKIQQIDAKNSLTKSDEIFIDKNENLYQQLWKDYFKSTNIVERKNTKLHIQHVPKRYWRYLTEKQI